MNDGERASRGAVTPNRVQFLRDIFPWMAFSVMGFIMAMAIFPPPTSRLEGAVTPNQIQFLREVAPWIAVGILFLSIATILRPRKPPKRSTETCSIPSWDHDMVKLDDHTQVCRRCGIKMTTIPGDTKCVYYHADDQSWGGTIPLDRTRGSRS